MKGRPTKKNTHPNKNSLHKQFAQANFMDTWKKCVLSAGKTMSVKFPFFWGGVLGGGECRFYFYGRADFSETIWGQFVQTVRKFPLKNKISRKEAEEFAQTVCANSSYLGGCFFWGGPPSLDNEGAGCNSFCCFSTHADS